MDQKLSKMFISSPNKAMIRESEAKFFIFTIKSCQKYQEKEKNYPQKFKRT